MSHRQKKLRDMIIPLSDYPHMPYWATLKEAVAQLNVAYDTGHHTVLVFDEGYNLVGMLSQVDILKGLIPKFAEHYSEGVPIQWENLLEAGTEKRLDLPIKDFMCEAQTLADGGDNLLKGAYLLVQTQSSLLPVIEAEKLIGVVRIGDVFHEITNAVLKL
ncbi:CBS-domain-containing protein [Olavius algarvensis associated proteobacterium Delta 3]|nr:CBS-domain-containing protein [Olavius algarvensis associated proteobacterium Delta 3]